MPDTKCELDLSTVVSGARQGRAINTQERAIVCQLLPGLGTVGQNPTATLDRNDMCIIIRACSMEAVLRHRSVMQVGSYLASKLIKRPHRTTVGNSGALLYERPHALHTYNSKRLYCYAGRTSCSQQLAAVSTCVTLMCRPGNLRHSISACGHISRVCSLITSMWLRSHLATSRIGTKHACQKHLSDVVS